MFDSNIREEELKNKVAQKYFGAYDATEIISNVDFSVADLPEPDTPPEERLYYLWAEAKSGTSKNIYHSLVQLILTVGRYRVADNRRPPEYLGAFDAEKIAFIPFGDIVDIFSLNDFNWTVRPSDHETKEFGILLHRVEETLRRKTLFFGYDKDDEALRAFIKNKFRRDGKIGGQIRINRNNFVHIYRRWREKVMPSIDVNWEVIKKQGIISADFFLADVLSDRDRTLAESLFVLLEETNYTLARGKDEGGFSFHKTAEFEDQGKAHKQFWDRYVRPPKKEYWDYLISRRDLLVPQDVRERKGSFFTPRRWVELSQEKLGETLGEEWQDRYYIWDCCAGTGNLLEGLTNKYNIYASTLDKQDVDVIKERIGNMNAEVAGSLFEGKEGMGSNLLESHIFQFDFLNDDLLGEKVPDSLKAILKDPEERKKLIVYINPPYAEATNARTVTGTGENRSGVATEYKTHSKYKGEMGKAANEIYAQFLMRIYKELNGCILGQFSKLKHLLGSNFKDFRTAFRPKLLSLFLVPADTFDNVKGQFPIGFFIWDTAREETFTAIEAEVYDRDGMPLEGKQIEATEKPRLTQFLKELPDTKAEEERIGLISVYPPDMQNNNRFSILSKAQKRYCNSITASNLIGISVYFAVRLSTDQTWLNDRDQFYCPEGTAWSGDGEFLSDCLIYTLFHGQNRITSSEGVNHWIPFTESEVGAKERFKSRFMTDFISGKLPGVKASGKLIEEESEAPSIPQGDQPIALSPEAELVMESGRNLWRYYHSRADANPDASFYDIREYFQGRDDKGRMNNGSADETYTRLLENLRRSLRYLGDHKIAPKTRLYGFLLG